MNHCTPWASPDWHERSAADLDAALQAVGRRRTGPVVDVKAWGRACLQTAPTERGLIWLKHGYALPPGEDVVLTSLSQRWSAHLPEIVTTWPGSTVMEVMPGSPLTEEHPLSDWLAAAHLLGTIAHGEVPRAGEWLALGVRDRRPANWQASVELLRASPVVQELEPETLDALDALLPDFVKRYVDAFATSATLVPQDSGCCNIHITPSGPILFDWADVVVGHPAFSCDRLLDQVPRPNQAAVIEAFLEPLDCDRAEFDSMRRSNVLHEVLRYHDELQYIPEGDDAHASLQKSVRAQLRVIVKHELSQR